LMILDMNGGKHTYTTAKNKHDVTLIQTIYKASKSG